MTSLSYTASHGDDWANSAEVADPTAAVALTQYPLSDVSAKSFYYDFTALQADTLCGSYGSASV
jgi:hypothetical protein